jgi:hypothetical protein
LEKSEISFPFWNKQNVIPFMRAYGWSAEAAGKKFFCSLVPSLFLLQEKPWTLKSRDETAPIVL